MAGMDYDERQLAGCLENGDPLRVLLEGTAAEIGVRFFEVLVNKLARTLGTKCAWVTEYVEAQRRLKALAFHVDGQLVPDFSIDIDNTPCEAVIDHARWVHYPDNILELFPNNAKLKELQAVSYLAVPLLDLDGTVIGHLAVIDDRPMPKEPNNLVLFRIFADRAAAELRRMRAADDARNREEQLNRLVQSAMDGIIELDESLNIVLLNPAAEKILDVRTATGIGRSFVEFLGQPDGRKIEDLVESLHGRIHGAKHRWVPGGLTIIGNTGKRCTVEATLTQFEMHRKIFYTLIMRSIDEHLQAERKIQQLKEQAAYLRNEINALDNFQEIIGDSDALQSALLAARQVASTDTSVLILGETGTGKELIAHAIHRLSHRANKPLIKINCAALPPGLVESELFGHEAGAFTGAERRRKGRFEMADGGTIFMDEIGEMPPALQAKLLRVLQEGRFERVGGSAPIQVDVRLIAATHRDLYQEIMAGRFRADLFYRIHVYPITAPALRERREDIPALVRYFVTRLGHRMRKAIDLIPEETMAQLVAYDWPGNVRELKNVVERAMIISSGNKLLLPEKLVNFAPAEPVRPQPETFHTLAAVERQYIAQVLQAKGWRISGPRGAARVLGINPSTLRYRINKLGIRASA